MIALALSNLEVKSTAPSEVRLRLLPPPSRKSSRGMQAELHLHDLLEEARRIAVLEERQRIARDLHDTLAQGFTGVIVQLEAADDALLSGRRKAAGEHMVRAAKLARASLRETRRCVHGLRPAALERLTFCAALQDTLERATEGTGLRTNLDLRGDETALPTLWEDHLLHIVQEALSNTLKHAHASRFHARLSFTARGVRLEMQDDGIGIANASRASGIGLIGMRERVAQMNGTLAVTSAPHAGTRILVCARYKRPEVVRLTPQRPLESGRSRCGILDSISSLARAAA